MPNIRVSKMIKKIISGAQTGADRAALDVARRLDIPYGGWVPKGRLAEDGPISKKYHLQEMPSASYPKRTEQNVMVSDGTLILSHGNLTGGSKYTMECADKHKRPWLHVDLNKLPAEEAVSIIVDWIFINKIEVLNVAGSRASKDLKMYEKTYQVINHVYWLCQVKSGATKIRLDQPKTVDEAVEQIMRSGLEPRLSLFSLMQRSDFFLCKMQAPVKGLGLAQSVLDGTSEDLPFAPNHRFAINVTALLNLPFEGIGDVDTFAICLCTLNLDQQ